MYTRPILACLFFYVILSFPALAQQDYPNKPIKVIVLFPAGGVTDLGARIVLDRMSTSLGQPILIDNRPGAGTKLGTLIAVKAPKDGYTLYLNNNSYSILAALDSDPGYDAENDLTAIGLSASYGMAMIVNPSTNVQSLAELIDIARKNPGKLTYGSAGLGSGTHFMGEHFKQLTGTDILHVPYKSTQLATQDVAGGRIDIAFEGSVKPYVDSGKVRIIAVTDVNRDPRFPNIPTVSEAGLPEFTFASWLGLFAPNGLTDKQIMRLNQALNEATSDISVKRRLSDMGLTATIGPPNLLRSQIKDDLIRYKKIAATVKIKIQ